MEGRQSAAILALYDIYGTWEALEARTGVRGSTWRTWRDEKFVPGKNGQKVADALGCEVDHLLGRKPWPEATLSRLRAEVATQRAERAANRDASDAALAAAREMLLQAEIDLEATKRRAEGDVMAATRRAEKARALLNVLTTAKKADDAPAPKERNSPDSEQRAS